MSQTREITIDEIVENTIIDLENAMKAFRYTWDRFFAWAKKPEGWDVSFDEISSLVTAHKMQLESISEKLSAAYKMGNDYYLAEISKLINENKEDNT